MQRRKRELRTSLFNLETWDDGVEGIEPMPLREGLAPVPLSAWLTSCKRNQIHLTIIQGNLSCMYSAFAEKFRLQLIQILKIRALNISINLFEEVM